MYYNVNYCKRFNKKSNKIKIEVDNILSEYSILDKDVDIGCLVVKKTRNKEKFLKK